jgi:hypothetical protein
MVSGYPVWQVILYPMLHFVLSSYVGWQAYSWTLTTLLRITGSKFQTDVSSIHMFSFLVALSFALVSHLAEDYFVKLF